MSQRAVVGTIGEGLLEVGIDPALAPEHLGRGFGGDAANVAVMAAGMGAEVRVLTRVGEDTAGRLLLDFWRARGVDVSFVGVDPTAPTGLYVNESSPGGDHQFSYHRSGSAASLLNADDLSGEFLEGLDVLHVTGITLAISASAAYAAEAAIERARAAGVAVSFAVNYRPQLAPDRDRLAAVARHADVVFVSTEDARGLLGVTSPAEITAALGSHEGELVITDGHDSALLLSGVDEVRVAPPPVLVVDTAGAGDALAGAYLAGRFGGSDPSRALVLGVAAGALSCRGTGCARTYPPGAEVVACARALADGEPVARTLGRATRARRRASSSRGPS